MSNGNSGTDAKLMGIPVKVIFQAVGQVGIPVLFLSVICYSIFFDLGPRLVDAHVRFLDETGKTLQAIAETQKQIRSTLDEINTVERETQAFMEEVRDTHAQALEDHQQIMAELKKE